MRRNSRMISFIKKLIFVFEAKGKLLTLKRFKVKVALLTHVAYPRVAKTFSLVQPRFDPLITGTMSNLLHHSHKLRCRSVAVKSLLMPQKCIHYTLQQRIKRQAKCYFVKQTSSRATFKLFIDFLPSPKKVSFLKASLEQASVHRDHHLMLLNVI